MAKSGAAPKSGHHAGREGAALIRFRYRGLVQLRQATSFNTPIVTVDYMGTERVEKVRPKYELIGTHTAKRSFVTILRQNGVSVEAIMKVTGNSRPTLERYILRTESDALQEIAAAVR
jgi:hypothetical protein